ncbi:MAG: hypothetical protein GW890_02700, partial [Vibrio sp.]|nr:hypothetical protein [Vibrio sp.]
EEITKGTKRESKKVLLDVLRSFAQYKKRLNQNDKADITKAIQQHFSKDHEVLDIYKTEGDIKDFISDQTILDVV